MKAANPPQKDRARAAARQQAARAERATRSPEEAKAAANLAVLECARGILEAAKVAKVATEDKEGG